MVLASSHNEQLIIRVFCGHIVLLCAWLILSLAASGSVAQGLPGFEAAAAPYDTVVVAGKVRDAYYPVTTEIFSQLMTVALLFPGLLTAMLAIASSKDNTILVDVINERYFVFRREWFWFNGGVCITVYGLLLTTVCLGLLLTFLSITSLFGLWTDWFGFEFPASLCQTTICYNVGAFVVFTLGLTLRIISRCLRARELRDMRHPELTD